MSDNIEIDYEVVEQQPMAAFTEKAYLEYQLGKNTGNVSKMAKAVGMERTHLYRKLRSLGVDFRQTGGDD